MTIQRVDVLVHDLVLSSLNVRKNLDAGQDDAGINELANSIAEKGLLQPLIVRPAYNEKFEVIAGQRRLEACKLLGMEAVACNIHDDCSDEDALSVSLVENIQRADMAPLDKAVGLKALYGPVPDLFRVLDWIFSDQGEPSWHNDTAKISNVRRFALL